MIRDARRLAWAGLLVVAGCAAPPAGPGAAAPGPDPLGFVPDDFSVDLTVRAGPAPDREAAEAPGPPRPAGPRGHWVVFADGSLHWAADRADPAWGLPPRRRVLDRAQVAGLWSLLEQLGYAEPEQGVAPVNARLLDAAPGETVGLCIVTGHGRRWAVVSRASADTQPDPAMGRLIEHLDELSWATVPDTPAARRSRRPEYGPDPYARFRRP